MYGGLRKQALRRIEKRDADDWPVLACAMALGCPVWTEDADFFGTGVATWTTDRIALFLESAGLPLDHRGRANCCGLKLERVATRSDNVGYAGQGEGLVRETHPEGAVPGPISQADQISVKYVGCILPLALLAPDIVQALEQGDYPMELTATKLSRMVPLPMDWDEQRQLLGMA